MGTEGSQVMSPSFNTGLEAMQQEELQPSHPKALRATNECH